MIEDITQLREAHERKQGIKAKKQQTWQTKREEKAGEKLGILGKLMEN